MSRCGGDFRSFCFCTHSYALPFRAVRSLGPGDDAPKVAKLSAVLSLAILIGVMCCGRMLTFFRPPGVF